MVLDRPGMSIPISLTQTIRASQPLFTCAVLFAAFGQRFSTAVYSSLVVILAGFALSGWASEPPATELLHWYRQLSCSIGIGSHQPRRYR